MTICNDKASVPGSMQIIRHIHKADTPMPELRDLLVEILQHYRRIDNLGVALGVLEKSASFSDNVSWCSVIARIDQKKNRLDDTSQKHLAESMDYLEKLSCSIDSDVVKGIQKLRDRWMWKVLGIDALVLVLSALIVGGVLFIMDAISPDAIGTMIMQRPVFYSLVVTGFAGGLLVFHLFARRFILHRMIDKEINTLMPGMSIKRAMQKNARLRHSIFRPLPAGWNMLQQLRLKALKKKIGRSREMLGNVLEKYCAEKTADVA